MSGFSPTSSFFLPHSLFKWESWQLARFQKLAHTEQNRLQCLANNTRKCSRIGIHQRIMELLHICSFLQFGISHHIHDYFDQRKHLKIQMPNFFVNQSIIPIGTSEKMGSPFHFFLMKYIMYKDNNCKKLAHQCCFTPRSNSKETLKAAAGFLLSSLPFHQFFPRIFKPDFFWHGQ